MENYGKKKSGSGKGIVVVLLLVLIAGVVVSNYVGPGKGWIDRISKGESKVKKVVEPVSAPETPKTVQVIKKPTEEVKKVEPEKKKGKSEVKELYDSLFAKYRKKFPDPEVGKEYIVYLKSSKTRGKLKDFSDGKILIQKPGVTVTYRMDMVSKKSYPKLFPKKAAKILALRDLKKVLDEKAAAEEARLKEQKYRVADNKTTASSLPRSSSAKKFAYEPGAQTTPKRLKKPLASFADWVKVQQRRVGGKLGEKIYAKQQGRNVVLYLETSKLFRKQDYDTRFSVAEGMWQIWGFKCLDYGTARATSHTHLVLLDHKNRIIGGSSKDDSSNIWVKK